MAWGSLKQILDFGCFRLGIYGAVAMGYIRFYGGLGPSVLRDGFHINPSTQGPLGQLDLGFWV